MSGCGAGKSVVNVGQAPQITTSPALYPAFDPAITDYVIPAATSTASTTTTSATASTSVQFTANALESSTVSVDGQAFQGRAFTTTVNNMDSGKEFSFSVRSASGTKTYYVRRLPSDFPSWTTERPGTPQAEFYVFAPNLLNDTRNYVIVADNYGVPIWWYHTSMQPIDAKLLSSGNVEWIAYAPTQQNTQYSEEMKLDGTLVRTTKPTTPADSTLDAHEFLLLPNGNRLIIADENISAVDLSPYGGSSSGTILNEILEEINPSGVVVWQWSTKDHIPLSETAQTWWSNITDPYHMNSAEWDGSGYVVSFRHLDAVYRIDRATSAITWKLGGSSRAESLNFVGDSLGNFGGQHDARLQPDGTITVHDNGTDKNRPPRAVRYKIDTVARTATLIEQVTDPTVQSSEYTGSARKLSGGNWVVDWGGDPYLTEFKPDGSMVLRLTFQNAFFSYRAPPIPYGTIDPDQLRSGMNTQFPR